MARIDRLDETTRNLVKVASVIGRSFFHRILSEVAGIVQGMEDRLTHLKEVQIIRQRKRMGEIEYLFKHTLAHEAAYESILPAKRRELHLKVAVSIEKVFGERLHEFHGMLAYHYSMAESFEKAEDYLIKAGEEALRSSASNEALNYYQEALNLYTKIHGQMADPGKVAMLEKNIAIALYNRGQYEEAVDYFDKTLQYYWGKIPTHPVLRLLGFSSAFLHFIIALYFPLLKFRKTPTEIDNQAIDLFYKKCKALAIIDPKRFFVESLYVYKNITEFDLHRFQPGMEIFIGASALFSFTGFSFRLSRKILDSARMKIQEDDARQIQ
jgi:tetratricopeptide (TPR) repeat protein